MAEVLEQQQPGHKFLQQTQTKLVRGLDSVLQYTEQLQLDSTSNPSREIFRKVLFVSIQKQVYQKEIWHV